MILVRTRLLFLVALGTLLLAFPLLAAGKRRAVNHPTNTTTELRGIVVDSVSGLPVVAARIESGRQRVNTGDDGRFVLDKLPIGGNVSLTIDRTGYAAQTITTSLANSQTVTIRLVPEPTASLRKADGTVVQLDYDSIEFGYLNSFAGYVKSESEEFCLPDGSHQLVNRASMKRLIGPAVRVSHGPCCTTSEVFKMKAELRNGTTTDVYFDDSCSGYPVDVIARNHVTGQFEYIPFAETAELVFPATPASAARAPRTTRH